MMKIIGNILTIVLIAWLGAKELGYLNKVVGVELEQDVFQIVSHSASSKKMMKLPDGKNALWIYWATWCAPCKLEMERLGNADIDHSRVFAINMSEPLSRIENFIEKNHGKYPFTFLAGGERSARKLEVTVAPSVYHVKNNKISWFREGMSLFGIFRAESLIPRLLKSSSN